MKRKLILVTMVVSFCLLGKITFAQKFQITGMVIQENDSAVFCNIKLVDNKNTLINGTITDNDGKFVLNNNSKNSFFLIVSAVGFITDSIYIQDISRDIDVGIIYLKTSTTSLNGVTVSAKYIFNKNGIKYALPTPNQVKSSTNGIMLLGKMNLPRLLVDGVSNSIQVSGGGQVQLRINGRETTLQEIATLQPDDVIRVEYHDKPEARYNYAAVVLDYIVKHHESGGYIYTEIWNGLLKSFGEDTFVAKLNNKKSEFSASYYLAYRDWYHLWRENHETFNFENNSITRDEKGKPADFEYYNNRIVLSYNYQEGNKMFNISSTTQLNNQLHKDWNSDLYSSTSVVPLAMVDSSQNKLKYPSISIYYQYPVSNHELFIINVSGLYSEGFYDRFYTESRKNSTLTDLNSDVKEQQYSGGFSCLYQNKTKLGSLDIGLKQKSTFTEDIYKTYFQTKNSTGESTLDIHNSYFYAQLGNQIKKWYYRIGIGGNANWQIIDKKTHHYIYFQPTLTLGYSPKDDLEFSFVSTAHSTAPTLSWLSVFDQNIDSLQIIRGNPGLKPQMEYYNSFSVGYNKKIFGLSYYLNHTFVTSPLMEDTYLENIVVIRTMENQKQFQKINSEIEFRSKPYKDFFTLKIYTGVNYYMSEGNNYKHEKSFFYYGCKVGINYKKYTLSWLLNQNTYDSFWGETLSRGESAHMVSFSYNTSKYYIGIDCINMFSTKQIASKDNYSVVAPYSRYEYLSELRNLIRFKISYAFRYGKEYNAKNKKIRISDDKESGILKGEK